MWTFDIGHMINYNTKSILIKESEAVQLLWLENDSVEGISKDQAEKIITTLKMPRTIERKPLLGSGQFDGPLSPTKYQITMSITNYDVVEEIVNYLSSVGVVSDYNMTADMASPISRGTFTFYLGKGFSADGHYSAATKITNGLIKKLGVVSPDYRISFTDAFLTTA